VRAPTRGRVARYLGLSVVLGALAGVGWSAVTPLATYTVRPDGTATTTERALTTFFAGDAWFSGFGLVVGVVLGTLGWRWFARGGWRVVLLVVLAAGLAALSCWGLGHLLGPGSFEQRLAAARPGDVVPIDLALRAPSTLLVWVVAAVAPVLVGSSLGHDPDDTPTEPVEATTSEP
jgi:hypothetical protein